MNQTRSCGCKGWRSCLLCESKYQIHPTTFVTEDKKEKGYVFCNECNKAWRGWDQTVLHEHPNHQGDSIDFPGIYILTNFLTDAEKEKLLEGLKNENWDSSQSGRRKQNYGPKCNFKKNKIQLGAFSGFPKFSKFVQEKFKQLKILESYQVIEQCSLEYDPLRGASIEPHIDDCWIWGERIVTVNVLGDTFLTMTKYVGDTKRYNLCQVESYPRILGESGQLLTNSDHDFQYYTFNLKDQNNLDAIVRIFMPEKSLIVMYGNARYEWEHSVLRKDITSLRICLAYREFTPPYLPGGKYYNIGEEILDQSQKFW